ncbi:predicted protein [Histoplasma capsulatum var. duboisii H88]|uniref:Predicted protein n=2 Tax=Ajellomyces capsulatus TaxID=5037 RepID=F0UJE2_AJEC8|nr:predicted protein [Histoplasma capsulatum H143]EGC45738.1 predicted protein [Histoplasma capsulatum var. duboisii H88]
MDLRRTKNSDYVLLAPRIDGHLGEMAMIVRTQKPLSCCAGPSGSKTQRLLSRAVNSLIPTADSFSQQGRLGSKQAGVYGTIHLSASREVIEAYFERSLAEHSQEGRKAPETAMGAENDPTEAAQTLDLIAGSLSLLRPPGFDDWCLLHLQSKTWTNELHQMRCSLDFLVHSTPCMYAMPRARDILASLAPLDPTIGRKLSEAQSNEPSLLPSPFRNCAPTSDFRTVSRPQYTLH